MSLRTLSLCALVLALVATSPAPAAARGKPAGLRLTADAVSPGPGDATASGTFKVSVGRDELSFSCAVANVAGLIQSIAIYRGAPGTNGSLVVRCSPSVIGIYGLNGIVPVTSTLGREIARNPERFYMEIRTDAYPQGALRGQLRQ